uniref:Rab3-GAP regulatory subunit N-terminal domain-containing protein n=1 Tax=Anopheles atroparvus TaxID=41427 RepID=A0A182ILN3_ANOAO
MSCEVKLLSNIDDLNEVQEQFGLRSEENWLNAVSYSLSPAGDILALGHGSILVVLASRWDRQRQLNVYKTVWRGAIDDTNRIITSILCTPIVGQGQSSQSMVDFSYIIVGLDSGEVLFYGENGTLIHSQIFHQEPIQALKAQSGKHINEELYVMYPSCSVILQGSQVFPLLRSLRQQINRYGAGSPKINEAQESIACRKWSYEKGMTIVDAAVVGPQKSCTFDHLLTASLEGGFFAKYRHSAPQNSLIIATGSKPYVGFHYAKEGFTQPVLADVARAVASKIKSALPSWLGGGGTSAQPQTASEPQLPTSEPLICRFGLCDLQRNAFAVWLAPNYQLAAVADNLGRIILVDCQRGIALRIWKGYRDAQCGFVEVPEKLPKEPSTATGSARKMDRRKALFLVIYAPRRSVLEVWSLRSGGPKVAAFSAAKNGQLIYNTHSQMGVTSGASKIKYTGHGCTFLDPTDCSLKEIVIPFHCALSDSKSKVAKDLHLLKRLKICLKTGDGSEAEELEEMTDMCRNFETDEIRLQCVEMLAKQRKIRPKLFAGVVDIFAEVAVEGSCTSATVGPSEFSVDLEDQLEDSLDTRSLSMQAGKGPLRVMCENYQRLVMFYQFLHGDMPSIDAEEVQQGKTAEAEPKTEGTAEEEMDDKTGEKQMNVKLSDQELTVIEQLIELIRMNESEGLHAGQNGVVAGSGPSASRGVKFDESAASGVRNATFMEYLSSFNVANEELILLRDEHGTSAYASLGKIIFERLYRFDQHRLVGFVQAAEACGLMPEDLLRMFLAYWLRLPFTYRDTAALVDDLNRFNAVLHQICLLAREKIHFGNNAICLWWQAVREFLLESPCALRGLLAALMCRNEALRHENRRRSDEEGDTAGEQFEQVSQEACQWMLLIYKLEDVAILGTILAECVRCRKPCWPTLKYHKPVVSLKEILTGGKGIVSELAAKWVASTGIEPAMLVIEVPQEATETEPKPGDGEPKASSSPGKELSERGDRKERNRRLALLKANLLETSEYGPAKEGGEQEELDPVLYNLNILRLHFPFSLDSGQLLAQLAWEYIGAWSRNMPNMACLQAGLACLSAIPRLQYSIKHGLCCMIWNAHLKIPLEATKKLVNKVGRLPKEKLCLQDIGISDALVPQFLECCLEFFDQFAGSIDHDKIELRFEDLLQEGPVPLTVLATQQNSANMALLRLHQELTTALLILTSFSVRHASKPIQQLFDGMANQAFFSEINRQLSTTGALPKADQLLRKARLEFLCRTVTATMDLIREDMETVYYADHNTWMDTIERLAGAWELEFGDIRKHQIIELYAHGWDTYAHELLENVVADHTFANLLLTIAGRRLALYTKANPSSWGQIAAVGPLLTDYLDTLVSNSNYGPPLRFAETDEATLQTTSGRDLFIEKITKLTEKAFNCLSSLAVNTKGTSKELRVAGLIFDACATIKDHRH